MSEVSPILVTGALGCIGEAVCGVLHTRGASVVGMDMRSPALEERKKFSAFIQADIRDEALLARAVMGASGVIHLAGWVHRLPKDKEEESEVYQVNENATKVFVVSVVNLVYGLCLRRQLAYTESMLLEG